MDNNLDRSFKRKLLSIGRKLSFSWPLVLFNKEGKLHLKKNDE